MTSRSAAPADLDVLGPKDLDIVRLQRNVERVAVEQRSSRGHDEAGGDLGGGGAARRDSRIQLRRQADAPEVAEAFLYLASSASSYVTGTWLDVNGGVVLR